MRLTLGRIKKTRDHASVKVLLQESGNILSQTLIPLQFRIDVEYKGPFGFQQSFDFILRFCTRGSGPSLCLRGIQGIEDKNGAQQVITGSPRKTVAGSALEHHRSAPFLVSIERSYQDSDLTESLSF